MGGYRSVRGHGTLGRSAGWLLPALRERALCPSAETKPPVLGLDPVLARAIQIFKVYLGTHDIVWPFKVQTQDVGMRGSIPLGLLVVHGKTWRAIFVGEPPRFRTHSFEPINLYSLILCLRRMTDCGQKPESQILGRLGFSALENAFGSPQAAPVARRQTPKRLRHQ